MTNILLLPQVSLTALTGNNEDWIEVLLFTDELGNQVSLDGIDFQMEMRHHVPDHEVVIKASVDNGRILIGGFDSGVMQITVPIDLMSAVMSGDYVMDILASAEGYQRRIVAGAPVTIFPGVVRLDDPAGDRLTLPPSNILVLPMLEMTVAQVNTEDWLLTIVYNDLNGLPFSLADIEFDFQMRHAAEDKDIVVSASTDGEWMTVTPDDKLQIAVPASAFFMTWPDDYVGEIVGTSFGYRRVVARISFTFTEGVTR